MLPLIKKLFPPKWKRSMKEHLGVPSLHWSLQNLKRKGFIPASVVDIGAYEGNWTADVLEIYPNTKILMVEAQSGKTAFLQSIKETYPNTEFSISLLSGEDGISLKFDENETASHVVRAGAQGANYKRLTTSTLDTLVKIRRFPMPNLLKLDVQGHELEVLKGAGECLAHATVCLLEISLLDLGDNTPLLADMIAFMNEKGFQAYDISQFIRRPSDLSLYQIDMFFVKKDSWLIADKRW